MAYDVEVTIVFLIIFVDNKTTTDGYLLSCILPIYLIISNLFGQYAFRTEDDYQI